MSSPYSKIKEDNIRRYGTDIARIGPMLLANRYDDRTHFIFELLQNAEDALKRRNSGTVPRSVAFDLSAQSLRVSHYGEPFTESDVRGICGIGESTKTLDLTAIGRFGIGFKAVYAFTDSPEIHSRDEHFAIDSFVWPRSLPSIERDPDQTVFEFPFRLGDESAHQDIAFGLRQLGVRTLLFLREIEGISWSVQDGTSGTYVRGRSEPIGKLGRRVVLIGEATQSPDVEETWLIFSREVRTETGGNTGYVEIAFRLDTASSAHSIRRVADSTLVAFFPTIVATNLGFLVQGPYRTTPSRDNVPHHDLWNQALVRETATLLVTALQELRGLGLLTAEALRVLPIDRAKFGEDTMFAPLFDATKEALASEPLLPCSGGTHVPATAAKLASTKEMRELFNRAQLKALFQSTQKLAWLTDEITQNRTPELRQYLMRELTVAEVTPDMTLGGLTTTFLAAQSDAWIARLYKFLVGQRYLVTSGRLRNIPIVRLENGTHVMPWRDGKPNAFLPSSISTDFPTVKRAVCESEEARGLLSALGLTEADPIDDVVRNILPHYKSARKPRRGYVGDVKRMIVAYATDSKSRRAALIAALRAAHIVAAIDAKTGAPRMALPSDVYLATERLNDLFHGVAGVLLVDDSQACMRGEEVRDLLEACGAARYLEPVPVEHNFTPAQRLEMRTRAGAADSSSIESIDDFTLRGLDQLLEHLATLDSERASEKSRLLWQALSDVEDRRGARAFYGAYRWFYVSRRSCSFEAAFVQTLNTTAWIPVQGGLERPGSVVFDKIEPEWKPNPFLLSKVRFKPPILEMLAREAGIEPRVLDLLKELGVTNEAELRAILVIDDSVGARAIPRPDTGPNEDDIDAVTAAQPHFDERSGPSVSGNDSRGPSTSEVSTNSDGSTAPLAKSAAQREATTPIVQGISSDFRHGPFISYVAVDADETIRDPDGLNHQARLDLEEQAIRLILIEEPALRRTPLNNPGFDLIVLDCDRKPIKWVEVKAMTGTLKLRPVGLSKMQFDTARLRGEAYWLYVVESAGSAKEARIVRIQDPAGKTQTYTFDHGWLAIASFNPGEP